MYFRFRLAVCLVLLLRMDALDASIRSNEKVDDAGLFRALLTGIYSAYEGSVPDVEDIRMVLSTMEAKPEALDRNQAAMLGSVLGGLLSGSVIRTSGDLLQVNHTAGSTSVKSSISSLIPAGTIASLLSGIVAGVLRPDVGNHENTGCAMGYPPFGYPVYSSGYPGYYPPGGYPMYPGYNPVLPVGSYPQTAPSYPTSSYPTSFYPGSYPSYPGSYPSFPGYHPAITPGSYIPPTGNGYPGNQPFYPILQTTPPPPASGSPLPADLVPVIDVV